MAMNVLVSGVAGDIGLGVGRILRDWGWEGALHGIDVQTKHAGSFVFDQCSVAPRANDASYIDFLAEFVVKHNIKFIIPTSEAEIAVFTHQKLSELCGAQILRSNELVISKSLDKYECLSYLSAAGVQVPQNGLVGTDAPSGYPVILKPRFGQGSKGILRIESESEYRISAVDGYVWQKYLAPEDEEYTCPVYRSDSVAPRILLIKRKLQGGLTGSGEVVENFDVLTYVTAIVSAMQLDGVMNIQLRLTESGPYLFEINPRLSSTLVFRDKLGFCDLRWWLMDKMGLTVPDYVAPRAGTTFYRGAQEYIHFNESV